MVGKQHNHPNTAKYLTTFGVMGRRSYGPSE